MLSSVQGFVSRHRRGLAVTAGVTGGIYLMGKYAKSKLIEFQEKSASERTAKENMKRRFEQNQQDCVFTVLSLLPTLGDQLLHELNVELITAKLQQTRSQRSTPAPTPDSSMILPPKPAEGDASTEGANASEEEAKEAVTSESVDSHEGSKEVTDTKGDHEPTVDTIANGDSESHQTTNAATQSDTAAPETSNEDAQKESVVNGSVPENQVQQKEQEQNGSTTELQQAAQVVVKDEVTAALERRTKLELWNELKIMSFTRTITALYSLTLLTMLTQVQLNLLGRFTYVSSVVALSGTTDASYRVESPSTKGSLTSTNGLLDFQTEKKYLTFSYWLLHEGWRRWSEKVRVVVEDVIGGISLKRALGAKEFSNLLGEIRARLEYTEEDGKRVPVNMREYMLPDEPAEEREVLRAGGVDEFDLVVDPVLRSLLDETRDFIDSADFSTVLSATLTSTFARFNLALQPTFNPFLLMPPRSINASIEEIEDEEEIDREVPLATLLPLVARQVHLIINGVPNEYVESLSMVKELQAFSAIVYSSFSEDLIGSSNYSRPDLGSADTPETRHFHSNLYLSKCFSEENELWATEQDLLRNSSRILAPRSMAALRHAQFSAKAAQKPEIVTYEEIDSLVHGKVPEKVVLIDVREPGEVAKGVIPTSHHVPLGSIQEALALPDKDFEERFGFKKFGKDDEVIFYCRSGKRSGMAFDLAKQLGYKGVRNYSGSWLDYEAKTSNTSK
ncbi:peroxin [Dissophora globulifera]|nr:peroxin [Dissophora globulifera]